MSDQVLATTETPQVIGHQWAVQLLRKTLNDAPTSSSLAESTSSATNQRNGPGHAYLFVGPRQIGKTTLARWFAQALLCTSSQDRPCGKCRSCQLMDSGNHPDFRLIQPTTKEDDVDRAGGMLRVEHATTIIREAALRPLESDYKFFLIQDMQLANQGFANKLLKTLEEPPAHVVICVTAHERNALLPTIVSRCQVMELRPVDAPTIEEALIDRHQVAPERARLLSRLANGRPGWALAHLHNEAGWQQRTDQLEMLWQLSKADRLERIAKANKLAANRDNSELFGMLSLWTSWWRDVMLAQCGNFDACCNIDFLPEIKNQAQRLEPSAVRTHLQTLARIERYLHHTVNTELALDVLLLQIPRPIPSQR
jgi:DNA polymerase-3 subunit delta'